MAYHLYYASFVRVFNIGGEDYDPENFPDVETEDYFLPDEVIEEFLFNYLEYSGDTTTTIEEITTEFNMHTAYLALSKIAVSRNYFDDLEIGDRIGVLSPTFYASVEKYQIDYINILLVQVAMNGLYGAVDLKTFQWVVCKLEELQKLFDHPDPIDCLGFPYNRPNCDECESILVDCIMNCEGDSTCVSNCNRDHAGCLESCQ